MLMTKAYAKINLGLNVLGKDEIDSYHFLDMVCVPIDLHDRIEIEVLPFGFDTLITADDREVPTDETNIVARVERALKEKCNYNTKFRIHIHKKIPMGAGLGGGSADGASVLLGINKILKLKLSLEELCEIGQSVGSDIPFCLRNISARVEEKGNKIKPIKNKSHFEVLILFPKKSLSTKEVYQKYDQVGSSSQADIEGIIEALGSDDQNKLFDSMANQLEEAAKALYPQLEDCKKVLLNEGFEKVFMTGSGSAIFTLSKNKKLVKKAYDNLSLKGYCVIWTKTK